MSKPKHKTVTLLLNLEPEHGGAHRIVIHGPAQQLLASIVKAALYKTIELQASTASESDLEALKRKET